MVYNAQDSFPWKLSITHFQALSSQPSALQLLLIIAGCQLGCYTENDDHILHKVNTAGPYFCRPLSTCMPPTCN